MYRDSSLTTILYELICNYTRYRITSYTFYVRELTFLCKHNILFGRYLVSILCKHKYSFFTLTRNIRLGTRLSKFTVIAKRLRRYTMTTGSKFIAMRLMTRIDRYTTWTTTGL